jgi:hypothetical protein
MSELAETSTAMLVTMMVVLGVMALAVAYSVVSVLRARRSTRYPAQADSEAQAQLAALPSAGDTVVRRFGTRLGGDADRDRGEQGQANPRGSQGPVYRDGKGGIEHVRQLLEKHERELELAEQAEAGRVRQLEEDEDALKTARIIRFTPIRETLRALKHEFRQRQDIRIYRDARFEGWLMLGRRQVRSPMRDPISGETSFQWAKRVYEALRVKATDDGRFVLYRSTWPYTDEQWNQELLAGMGRDPAPEREEYRFDAAEGVIEFITGRVALYRRSELGRSLEPRPKR